MKVIKYIIIAVFFPFTILSQGTCISGDCENGKGYWKDEKGNSYDGDWDQNMRHGSGVHYCSNGYIYDGQWKSNVPEGRGIAIYPVRLLCLCYVFVMFLFCFVLFVFLKQIILLFADVC